MTPYPTSDKPWSPWHQRIHEKLQNFPNLLPKEACILIAISGGQDSMALAKIILDLRRIYKWKVFIWNGDHGWHSKSQIFQDEIKNWYKDKDKNIIFFSDQTIKEKTRSEEKARDWRYQCLIKQSEKIMSQNSSQYTYILTGHTGTDSAETLILNLSRGTDLHGLCSIPESRDLTTNIKLVRPLLSFSREETAQICKEFKLPIWIDPSNKSMKINRNRIRHEVIPILESLYPGCSLRMAALSGRLSSNKEEREVLANIALDSIKVINGINREKLTQLPTNTRSTILELWIRINGAPQLSAKTLNELSISIGPSKPPGFRRFGKRWKVSWGRSLIQIDYL
tara:strand:+ start:1097 stop:2113 length:1017 start_codon:yes stop_codon:yes gene_type:complete